MLHSHRTAALRRLCLHPKRQRRLSEEDEDSRNVRSDKELSISVRVKPAGWNELCACAVEGGNLGSHFWLRPRQQRPCTNPLLPMRNGCTARIMASHPCCCAGNSFRRQQPHCMLRPCSKSGFSRAAIPSPNQNTTHITKQEKRKRKKKNIPSILQPRIRKPPGNGLQILHVRTRSASQ